MNELNELITHLRREGFRKDGKYCSLMCYYSHICSFSYFVGKVMESHLHIQKGTRLL